MKKFLVSALAAATLLSAVIPVAAQAATTANNFNVSVTLSSQCLVTTTTTPTIAFGTYIAFGAAIGPVALSAPLTFKCTHNLPAPTVAFDTTNGAATGNGVLAGLLYTLTAPVLTRTNGADATSTVGATQDTYSYTFSGNIGSGQSGECLTASATSCTPSHTRQLIVTY